MKALKFNVSNFAKVEKASVELNGITVIVGENNSGKSTIGKSLYSLCSVFRNLDERVRESKLLSVEETLAQSFFRFTTMDEGLKERLVTEDFDEQRLADALIDQHPWLRREGRDAMVRKDLMLRCRLLSREIRKIRNIPDAQYRDAVVWDYFDRVFHSQITPVFRHRGKTTLQIINGEQISVTFESASTTIEKMGKLAFRAYYINGPVVANLLNSDSDLEALEIYDRELTEELRSAQNSAVGSIGVVGARKVSNRLKLKTLKAVFDRVVPGTVGRKGKGKLAVNMPGGEPICFENLSSGLKSFVLLWQVLEQGLLSDGDILILDEPEVRLHPEWQIVLAELMVLLCKVFDLRILLTSHSVDFIHALSLFVRKYKLSDRLRLYRSKVSPNGASSIDLVSNNEWERLFDTFVRAVDILAEIRDSLPEDD